MFGSLGLYVGLAFSFSICCLINAQTCELSISKISTAFDFSYLFASSFAPSLLIILFSNA
jgi:hypothetical protein